MGSGMLPPSLALDEADKRPALEFQENQNPRSQRGLPTAAAESQQRGGDEDAYCAWLRHSREAQPPGVDLVGGTGGDIRCKEAPRAIGGGSVEDAELGPAGVSIQHGRGIRDPAICAPDSRQRAR